MDAWTPKPIEPIRLLDTIDSVAIRHPLTEPRAPVAANSRR